MLDKANTGDRFFVWKQENSGINCDRRYNFDFKEKKWKMQTQRFVMVEFIVESIPVQNMYLGRLKCPKKYRTKWDNVNFKF